MYYLNILYCNVLSEDSCPASVFSLSVPREEALKRFFFPSASPLAPVSAACSCPTHPPLDSS